MNQVLVLDALYPPSPDQLVRDMDAVGADGVMIYCWRPDGRGGVDIGNWTPEYAPFLRSRGKLVMGIVVPPGNGGAPAIFLDAVAAMGILPGEPVGLDIEPPNTPPPTWEETFDVALKARGYVELDYGTQLELGLYEPDDNEWVAMWLRTGRLDPLPTMPAGWQAWQFVNDIEISGSQYDASIIDRALWPTSSGAKEDHMTDPQIWEHIIEWYAKYLNVWAGPDTPDWPYVIGKWTDAYKADPVQARFDFGVAAAADPRGGANVFPVRHFELDAALAALKPPPPVLPGQPGPDHHHDEMVTVDGAEVRIGRTSSPIGTGP